MTIGERIKKIRSEKNLSTYSLSEKTGISQSVISKLENGKRKADNEILAKLAEALNVSVDRLTGDSVSCIIENKLENLGITLKDVAEKANVSYDWLKDIDSFSPSLEPQFDEFDLSPRKPLEWDDEIYTRNSYSCISRVAKVIGLPPGMLRAALARQEVPLPEEEHNHISAREAFGFTNTISNTQPENESLSIQPTEKEQNIIKKYRTLDQHGKNIVDMVLNEEAERMAELETSQATVIDIQPRLENNSRFIEYHHSASAGTGVFILGNEGVDQLQIPDTPENRKVDYAIKVFGNSMEPDYSDGDIVLVSQKVELNHGDVGIFIINNNAYIKEYGETELISRNPDADNIMISEYDNIVCMGKVVGKYEE